MCDERGVEPRPASRSRISSAASRDTDRRYGRSDVAASNVSTTARMRAPIGMSRRADRQGIRFRPSARDGS